MKAVIIGPSDPNSFSQKVSLPGLTNGLIAKINDIEYGIFRSTLSVAFPYAGLGLDLGLKIGNNYPDYNAPNLLAYISIRPYFMAIDPATGDATCFYQPEPRKGFLKPDRRVSFDDELFFEFTKGNDFPADTASVWWAIIDYDLSRSGELELVQQQYGA